MLDSNVQDTSLNKNMSFQVGHKEQQAQLKSRKNMLINKRPLYKLEP